MKTNEIELSDKEKFESWKANNTDAYGNAIFEYAILWAQLMQQELSKGKTIDECADKASHDADTDGITGYMYGAAAAILSECWKYGQELRVWHNKKYEYEGDGIVNPAILTIDTDKT